MYVIRDSNDTNGAFEKPNTAENYESKLVPLKTRRRGQTPNK